MNDSNPIKVPSLAECLEVASDTEQMIVRPAAIQELGSTLAHLFPGASCYMIADETTLSSVGSGGVLQDSLSVAGITVAGSSIFPALPTLHADYLYVGALVESLKEKATQVKIDGKTLIPIAIGGGTINDLVKRAAFEAGLRYVCVPTAASVDGYTSYGAALLSNGFKRTFECPAPIAVIADSNILAASPAYLSSSGFGDLASKIIAGSDWIIAEAAGRAGALGTELINPLAWAMTQVGLLSALRRSEMAAQGDVQAVAVLFEALALTGFSMQYLKSSRPVSGCEHLFSHVWEMSDLTMNGIPVTHGHKVAIGTLCATAVTEQVFSRIEAPRWGQSSINKEYRASSGGDRAEGENRAQDESKYRDPAERESEVRKAFFGQNAVEDAVKTSIDKLLDQKSANLMREKLSDEWGSLRLKVLEQVMPYQELRAMLKRAGCPVLPEEIALTRNEALATARKAQMIRNRYTVLDLAWDFGILEETLAAIEVDKHYLR
ncbi:hypothetical protein MASR2M78_15290 [Treponema sp.]